MPNPVGRPSEYDPAYIDLVDAYLATCGREQTKLPKLTEYYRLIGISKQCADEWKDKYPEFGDACKRIEELQMEELIDDGLFGGKEVNQAMAIFLLKANHNMVETERKELVGKNGEKLEGLVVIKNGSSSQ